ncbi:uncharacterized protein PHACADRAFT_250145 [Phanerochaete carnosa HHB-10118-sp]|uniref:DUF3445 domain-containing protein n=1 Tax=Phanerochaete carnosa (strain HHB-10118-sp) TaxID=650164 RepID=K5WK82_PHACS|nr:uncharacterized protein PHACADRAFT_250145 [Phanerochaete carnosa HHB-10118-sp]EKM59559.1 hypothetical protein PHACADRAFT_250145 [Phanerochaete carnosa HHB-10118-sp]
MSSGLIEHWRLIAALLLCGAILVVRRLRGGSPSRGRTLSGGLTASEKHTAGLKPFHTDASAAREPGEWTPVAFEYPAIAPCREDVSAVKPVPYRPFKWGEYHVTMGIRSMPWDEWTELDREFAHFHRIREHRIQTRGDKVVQVLPERPGLVKGAHDAAVELVHELAEYLSRRYPDVYRATRVDAGHDGNGWHGQPSIKDITIIPLGKTYGLEKGDPLTIASLLIQEDLAIMIEGTDGRYYLQGGAILIPGSWRLRDKIGMSLDDIHISGTVPQFESKLQLSMSRHLKRMPVDKPIVRNNYSFQVVAPRDKADPLDPDELAWCKTMKGDEDVVEGQPGFLRNEDFGADYPGHSAGHFSAAHSDLANSSEPVDPSLVRLRVERQTLRRLPKTGAIVFTIRVYLTPLEELVKEPDVPGRLASAIRSWPGDVAKYKARSVFENILEYLDAHHQRQLDSHVEGVTRQRCE